jgi:hypothetical protein
MLSSRPSAAGAHIRRPRRAPGAPTLTRQVAGAPGVAARAAPSANGAGPAKVVCLGEALYGAWVRADECAMPCASLSCLAGGRMHHSAPPDAPTLLTHPPPLHPAPTPPTPTINISTHYPPRLPRRPERPPPRPGQVLDAVPRGRPRQRGGRAGAARRADRFRFRAGAR